MTIPATHTPTAEQTATGPYHMVGPQEHPMSTLSRALLVLLPTLLPASLKGVERRRDTPIEHRTHGRSGTGWRAEAAEHSWCPRIRWP